MDCYNKKKSNISIMASNLQKAAKIRKKAKKNKKKKLAVTKLKKKVAKNRKLKSRSKTKTRVKAKSLKQPKIKKRGRKMSTETIKSGSSPLLDTSHLKVPFPFKKKYGNYINGKFVEPKSGKYFDNVTPINNEVICKVARSDA